MSTPDRRSRDHSIRDDHLRQHDDWPSLPAPVQGPRIEEHVCIGGGVTIFPVVTVGRNSVIGAGSVVNKDVPSDTLAYGVPARHYPLPEDMSDGNLPELLLPQTDLWGAQTDESWRDE